MAFDSIGMPQLVITGRDEELNRAIIEKTVALGTGLADEFKSQMILLARDVINITPPAGGKANRGAYEAGEGAINRDLFLMGFVPVEIKGHRTITMAFGRPIAPVTVETHPNPKFDDPDSFHHARLLASGKQGRRGRASRGGAQAFYVAKGKFAAMKTRLYKEIGKLAAPWLPAIRQMNGGALPYWVPAWIARHEAEVSGRAHYAMNFDPAQGKMFIHFVNSMPDSASEVATDTQRKIESAKGYRINAIRRGLEGRAKRIAGGK
jgi:hypothetical protein